MTRLEWTVEAVVRLAKVFTIKYMTIYDIVTLKLIDLKIYVSFHIVMVQILLYTKDQATGVSWSLSPNCASNKQIAFHVEANKIYQESCTLEIGKSYELNCDSFAESTI